MVSPSLSQSGWMPSPNRPVRISADASSSFDSRISSHSGPSSTYTNSLFGVETLGRNLISVSSYNLLLDALVVESKHKIPQKRLCCSTAGAESYCPGWGCWVGGKRRLKIGPRCPCHVSPWLILTLSVCFTPWMCTNILSLSNRAVGWLRLVFSGAWVLVLRHVVIALTQQPSWDRVPFCSHLLLLGFCSKKKGQPCLGSDRAWLVIALWQGPEATGPTHAGKGRASWGSTFHAWSSLLAGFLPSESWWEPSEMHLPSAWEHTENQSWSMMSRSPLEPQISVL